MGTIRRRTASQRGHDTSRPAGTNPAVYWLLAVHGVASFCWGLVFPFTGIFLADQPGIGEPGVALYYGVAGAANLGVAALLATGVVRPPRVPLGVAGTLLWAGGYAVLASVTSLPVVALAAAASGTGQGCFLAANIPIVNSLTGEEDRRRIFALRYQILNATLALGSLAGGLAVTAFGRDVIRWLFLLNTAGWIPVTITLLVTRRAVAAAHEARAAGESDEAGLSVVQLLKATGGVAVFQLGVYLLGYGQFEATAPLTADRLMGIELGWISALLAINVGVIVTAQRWVTKALEPRPEVVGLRVAVGLWVIAYLVVGLASLAGPGVALAGLLAYGALFGLGECAYSCSYHPWLISRVPEHELTRANALSNAMMGIGLFIGPAVGVVLVTTGSAPTVWLVLAALCGSVAVATVPVRRRVRAVL